MFSGRALASLETFSYHSNGMRKSDLANPQLDKHPLKIHVLERQLWVARPNDEVFAFFCNAHNLDDLTPRWLHFEILTPAPIVMQQGTLIDYQLRLYGKRIRWRTEITAWKPPIRFIDKQLEGPYPQWIHTHEFRQEGGGTLIRDEVRYAVSGGWLEPLIHRFFVAPSLKKIFDHRRQRLHAIFPDS